MEFTVKGLLDAEGEGVVLRAEVIRHLLCGGNVRRAFETKISQSWSGSRAKLRPLIGSLSQNARPSRAIRASPVRLTFETDAERVQVWPHGLLVGVALRYRRDERRVEATGEQDLGEGREVIFIPPCLFCIENHLYNIQGRMTIT
jgi:hypothetical protein